MDFVEENELRNLIKRANMYDQLGDIDKANEVDELVSSLSKEFNLSKEALGTVTDNLQRDVEGIHSLLKRLKDTKRELLDYGPGYLDKIDRLLTVPDLSPEQKAYLDHLKKMLAYQMTGKSA